MSNVNEIYLRRANKIMVLHPETATTGLSTVATLNKNLESLGYTLSRDAIIALLSTDAVSVTKDLVQNLKSMVGDNVVHRPMYPNFPKQVMEASFAELYMNAMIHYLGSAIGMTILPVYDKEDRPELTHSQPLKIIDLGSPEDFASLMTNLIQSKVSFSQTDKEDVETYLKSDFFDFYQPNASYEIGNKENLATVAKLMLDNDIQVLPASSFKTATDVLRLAVAMSDGDVSLAEKSNFRKFKKSERRLLLSLLEQGGVLEEDMLRYASQWKRLGEILHPGEYAHRYPKTAAAFHKIRNNAKISTFNSRVEALIKDRLYVDAAELLSERPGEFARRLDVLLSRSSDADVKTIVELFDKVAHKVSISVLLQLHQHLANRLPGGPQPRLRSFFPKGNLARIKAIEETRPTLPLDASAAIFAASNGVRTQLAEREPLGKVWIDPALSGYTVPFGARSASKSLKTVGRGTRMALPESDTVRFFIHWKNISGGYDGRVDLDLSMGLMDEDFNHSGEVTYYNLRTLGGVHSGDITDAPNGASEFIDLDIDKALKAGHRYAYMNVNSYTHQWFSEIPECFAGFMARNGAGSGEIYDPRTVQDKADVTSESTQGMIYLVDLKEREVIWVDTTMPSRWNYGGNNLVSNRSNLSLLAESMVTRMAPNLYTLFHLHGTARGEIVENREDADVVFALDGDITPYDSELIMAEFL